MALETTTFEISGSPTVTNMFYGGALVDSDIQTSVGFLPNVTLYGTRFDLLDGILLSSGNLNLFSSLTSVNIQGKDPQIITGQLFTDYTVVNENVITFTLPNLTPYFRNPNGFLSFVPFNKAGIATTALTYKENGTVISTLL